jgi:uncharacterized protein (TIGR03089 family)
MAGPESIESLFAARLASASGAPLLTYYDTASGERMELSAASLANWVAKTHFLLTDELGLGAGDAALVGLPLHWMAMPVLLGCWSAGLSVTEDGAAAAAVAFVDAAGVASARAAGVPEVYALSFATWGRGFDGPPPVGAEDYVLAVRPQADSWAGVRFGAVGSDDAWTGPHGSMTRSDLVALGRDRAGELGLGVGGRLVVADTAAFTGPFWLDAVVAPLAVQASVVLVTGADQVAIERIAQTERATAIVA